MSPISYYIGTLSGTSIDAIDLALIAVDKNKKLQLIASYQQEIPIHLQQQLQQLCLPQHNELVHFGQADREFSMVTSQGVLQLLQQAQLQPKDIIAIGSHGQTIRHHPNLTPAFTLQLGCPATLAVQTGIDVISHFRQKDVALGGQGAPLSPIIHHHFFHQSSTDTAVVNLGGITNITWLPKQGQLLGFDSGPANTLIDAWYQHHHQDSLYDQEGKWASTGRVHPALLQVLLSDPYFALAPPKSTGREYFTLPWLLRVLSEKFAAERITPADIQATLVELTATSLCQALSKYAPAKEVYLCGGGVHNLYLKQRLQALAPNVRWTTTAVKGVDPDWLEAILFGWLAYCHLQKYHANITSVTGAQATSVLGSYTPA